MSKGKGDVIRRVRVGQLRIHPTAQRKLVPATLKKIDAKLDPSAVGVIHAVEYEIDGERALWVVDGQHRVTVLQAAGLGDIEVSVMVHTDVTDDAGASDLFLKLNTRASVGPYDEFRNELQAGDEVAVGVSKIVADHKLRVDRYNSDGTITCVKTLKSLYRKDNGDSLNKTLATATAAWGRTSNAVEGKLIEGLGLVYATFNGKVDRPALVKKLAKYPGGAPGLLGNAKAMRALRSATLGRCTAELIVETYNKGRRSEQLPAL